MSGPGDIRGPMDDRRDHPVEDVDGMLGAQKAAHLRDVARTEAEVVSGRADDAAVRVRSAAGRAAGAVEDAARRTARTLAEESERAMSREAFEEFKGKCDDRHRVDAEQFRGVNARLDKIDSRLGTALDRLAGMQGGLSAGTKIIVGLGALGGLTSAVVAIVAAIRAG